MTQEPVDAHDRVNGEDLGEAEDSGYPAGGAIDDAATQRGVDSPTERTAQSELDLGVVSTGSAVVDEALRPLESLGDRPVADHAEAYERVLSDLTEAMSDPAPAQKHDSDRSTPTG
ncbi:MAG TPA: hypothetical protein VMX11_04965 [Actinomycetes bacterium]|nr:hypothetical protein [Actinomycetes bacterium]